MSKESLLDAGLELELELKVFADGGEAGLLGILIRVPRLSRDLRLLVESDL